MTNVHQVVAHYLQEGQTTMHRRASLKERFAIMCRHYGMFSTLIMHLLFVFRALKRKFFG